MTIPMSKRAERYDRLAALRTDERFTHGHSNVEVREFIEAVYWSQWTTGRSGWAAIKAHLGWKHIDSHWRMMLRDDLPRWEPHGWLDRLDTHGCEYVMTRGRRAGEPCGKYASLRFRITNPETGEWRSSAWCGQHRRDGDALFQHENARPDRGSEPTPHPNRGGILPCYLSLRDTSWEDKYREAAGPGWEPPEVGVCADDWPTLTKVYLVVPRPKLTLILGDVS